MTCSHLRRTLSVLALASALPLFVLGCPKKQPEVVDAGPPAVVEIDSGPAVLAPLDDDAGSDAAPEAAVHHAGHPVNVNQARIKQCCNALRGQAKAMGASPEANVVLGVATQCDGLAAQAAGGTAPEFAAFRQMLQRGTLLPACQGL